nr:plasmid recombination protein [Leuconostoc sp.]
MAHLKKNTRGSVPGLAVHFERKTDHHTNKEIDVAKTYLNQDLMTDAQKSINWNIFIQFIRRHLRYDWDYKN